MQSSLCNNSSVINACLNLVFVPNFNKGQECGSKTLPTGAKTSTDKDFATNQGELIGLQENLKVQNIFLKS